MTIKCRARPLYHILVAGSLFLGNHQERIYFTADKKATAARRVPAPASTSGRRCAVKRAASAGVSASASASASVGARGLGALWRKVSHDWGAPGSPPGAIVTSSVR